MGEQSSVLEEDGLDLFLTGKMYTLREAAELAGTSYQNVYRWIFGYKAPGHQMHPVFGEKSKGQRGERPAMVSFLDLMEIRVATRFRKGRLGQPPMKLQRIRNAHAYARQRLGLPYPFATLKLKQHGGHILHEFDELHPGEGLLAISAGGQWMLPGTVTQEFEHFDYAGSGWVHRWFPFGPQVPIVINPHIAAGRPTIVDTGVTIRTIHDRIAAGDELAFLADDYGVAQSVIEEALRYAA